ncbi:uncharacterized protein LOC119446248 [Dermacentor silvarum]|uniref:uncharacterized protein LOC119446248 n=1 Tax=Dermacentor silvarum TaxID=543639 RepID=UPI001899D7D7|nr:uncharacterized protein LOC119446248 [Dermacentor silvarum]
MATQNEPRVLFCGYRRISNVQEYFKRSSLLRGGDLYAANHVYCVREELDSAVGPSEILGKCVAQMKSVEYEVRLELSAHERKIVQAYCTCKAGCRGWCKHGAALALYVNNHQHTSCTDLPCAWQKPSTRPTLDTKKSISELFPSRPIIKPILRPLSPTVVHSQFPDVNCAFRHVINFEESCAIEAPDAVVAVAAKQVDESHSDLVKNIFNNVRQLHHNFGVSTTLPLRLTKCDMLSTLSAKEKCFYQSVVSKSMDEVVEIALATRRQASVTRFVVILYYYCIHLCFLCFLLLMSISNHRWLMFPAITTTYGLWCMKWNAMKPCLNSDTTQCFSKHNWGVARGWYIRASVTPK